MGELIQFPRREPAPPIRFWCADCGVESPADDCDPCADCGSAIKVSWPPGSAGAPGSVRWMTSDSQ